jgi:hypothetical protein
MRKGNFATRGLAAVIAGRVGRFHLVLPSNITLVLTGLALRRMAASGAANGKRRSQMSPQQKGALTRRVKGQDSRP